MVIEYDYICLDDDVELNSKTLVIICECVIKVREFSKMLAKAGDHETTFTLPGKRQVHYYMFCISSYDRYFGGK